MLLLLSGCGYRFYSQRRGTVFLSEVSNTSFQPNIDKHINRSLQIAFIQSPVFLPVVTEDLADFILEVEISGFERSPLFYMPDSRRRIAGAKYIVEADIKLYGSSGVVFQDLIVEHVMVSLQDDFLEEDILIKVADKLANKIYQHMLEKR